MTDQTETETETETETVTFTVERQTGDGVILRHPNGDSYRYTCTATLRAKGHEIDQFRFDLKRSYCCPTLAGSFKLLAPTPGLNGLLPALDQYGNYRLVLASDVREAS